MPFFFFLAAIVSGIANPFQAGLNAELNRLLARPLWTTIFVYLSALAGLFFLQLFVRQALPSTSLSTIPWWAWMGGLVSIISTIIGLTVAQRLGSVLFTGATLTASLVTSVALDHFGLVGFRAHAATPARLAGCAMMIGGLWLIARF